MSLFLRPCVQLFGRFRLSLTCLHLLCRGHSKNAWLSPTACTCRPVFENRPFYLILQDTHLCLILHDSFFLLQTCFMFHHTTVLQPWCFLHLVTQNYPALLQISQQPEKTQITLKPTLLFILEHKIFKSLFLCLVKNIGVFHTLSQ